MQQEVTKLITCGEAIPPDIIPGSFIHVLAQFDAVRAGHDETFFGTHLRIAADVEIEALFKSGKPEFQDIHDWEADFVITDEGGPDRSAKSQSALVEAGATSSPFRFRLKGISPSSDLKTRFLISSRNSGGKASSWTFWIPVVGPLISGLLLAYFGVRHSLDFARRNNEQSIAASQKASEAAIWQKANETELKDLTAKLDGFYGPFMQMSQANHLVTEEFRSRQPAGFRTLPKVFDRQWLEALPVGDRKVIEEVCQKGADLEKFIAEKAGNVDRQVVPYLARASAHFHILNLAFKGQLSAALSTKLCSIRCAPWNRKVAQRSVGSMSTAQAEFR